MIEEDLVVGGHVRHSKQPAWGAGVVVSFVRSAAHVDVVVAKEDRGRPHGAQERAREDDPPRARGVEHRREAAQEPEDHTGEDRSRRHREPDHLDGEDHHRRPEGLEHATGGGRTVQSVHGPGHCHHDPPVRPPGHAGCGG
jgi:hypothetical protein